MDAVHGDSCIDCQSEMALLDKSRRKMKKRTGKKRENGRIRDENQYKQMKIIWNSRRVMMKTAELVDMTKNVEKEEGEFDICWELDLIY